MTTYVILNAAIDTTDRTGWRKKNLYKIAAWIGRCKFNRTHIVDIFNKPDYTELSQQDLDAIRQADKILIAGHCYEDDLLLDDNNQHPVSACYLAEFLGEIFNSLEMRERKISIVACESLEFSRALMVALSQYPHLVETSVTGRKYEIFVNPFNGSKYNVLPSGHSCRLFHHTRMTQIYKSRFSIDKATGNVDCEEIAGTYSRARPRSIPN